MSLKKCPTLTSGSFLLRPIIKLQYVLSLVRKCVYGRLDCQRSWKKQSTIFLRFVSLITSTLQSCLFKESIMGLFKFHMTAEGGRRGVDRRGLPLGLPINPLLGIYPLPNRQIGIILERRDIVVWKFLF